MSSVDSNCNCPNCHSDECHQYFDLRSDEFLRSCPDCGYCYHHYRLVDEKTGNWLLKDNSLPATVDNIVYHIKEIKKPFGVCRMMEKGSWCESERTFSTKKQYDKFLESIRNVDPNAYVFITVSRVVRGKKILIELVNNKN